MAFFTLTVNIAFSPHLYIASGRSKDTLTTAFTTCLSFPKALAPQAISNTRKSKFICFIISPLIIFSYSSTTVVNLKIFVHSRNQGLLSLSSGKPPVFENAKRDGKLKARITAVSATSSASILPTAPHSPHLSDWRCCGRVP